MKNKKTNLILLIVVFLMALFGNINTANAEVINNTKSYHSPYSGICREISVEAGDLVYWAFKTYDHEFLVSPTLIYEDGTNISYDLRTKGQGVIAFSFAEIITLEFMNYDVYSGYMELFIGLNEPPASEYVSITSVNCDNDRELIDLSWEVRGFVFFIKLDLYYEYEFVAEMRDEIQCDIHSSVNWGFDNNEDVFSGDKFHIRISDVDDPDVYRFSNYFTIEIDDPYDPFDYYESDYFLERLFWWSLIILVPIGVVVIVAVVLVKKHKRKSPKEIINVQGRTT